MDLHTTYLGLDLRSPLVPSASPLCQTVANVRKMEDAGAGAVVLHSLFEEQIIGEALEMHEHLEHDAESYAEALSFFPPLTGYNQGPEGYLEHVRAVKQAVDIPVIGSLNGVTRGGWVDYARSIEQAGADALELNIYFIATDPTQSSEAVEQLYVDILEEVKSNVTIPVAVKLGPFFSSVGHMAKRLEAAGAKGLVLFNRFYQPDIDIEALEVVPDLTLSEPGSIRLPLRWIAILRDHVKASLAATSGVHRAEDVLKLLMAGADVTMMAAALLRNGIDHLRTVETNLARWMEEHEYSSVRQMQGSMSSVKSGNPAAFERGNYVKALSSFDIATARQH